MAKTHYITGINNKIPNIEKGLKIKSFLGTLLTAFLILQ
jgi:hypothetical protein